MATFRESKAKIEAFLTKPGNLASVLPDLCSERFLSKQEELEVSLTGSSRRAHVVTKILENKITSQPRLFVELLEILQSHKFEKGGEADDDHGDSDLPLGMTIITDELAYSKLEDVSRIQMSSLPTDVEATKEQSQTADTSRQQSHDQSLVPTLESAPSTKASSDPVHSVMTHAATAAATHSVKPKAKKPGSRATAGLDVSFVREKVYTNCQLHKLKMVESEYPGIEFSAYCSTMTIGSKGGVIRGEGIQLRVPPNAIGRGKSRKISLRACIDGPFQLPEDVHLASPVFLVTCTSHGNLQRETTLTLHHFIQLTSHKECDMMVLLTSPQTPTRDEHGTCWRFEISDKQPRCFQNFTQGEVAVTHFSFMCFGIRIKFSRTRRVHPCKEKITYRVIIMCVLLCSTRNRKFCSKLCLSSIFSCARVLQSTSLHCYFQCLSTS